LIEDRFQAVLDKDEDGFISEQEFLKGMAKIFVGTLEQKLKLTFKIYDCDKDSKITQDDVK
jgi:Ca2+-binding EF-hand superfamily protein